MSLTEQQIQLYRATCKNDAAQVRILIDGDPSLISTTVFGKTMLHHAAISGALETLGVLLECGMKLDVFEEDEKSTPFSCACAHGKIEAAQFLLDHGADIEGGKTDCTPLISSIIKGELDAVKFLVKRGADTERKFKNYGSPMNALQVAEYWKHNDIIQYLMKIGNAPDSAYASLVIDPLQSHVEKYFGAVSPLALTQIVGNNSILVARSQDPKGPHTLVTKGMSERPMKVPKGSSEYKYAELVMHLPGDWPMDPSSLSSSKWLWPFQWLLQLSDYPFANNTWLGGEFAVIENGDPAVPVDESVQFTGFLLLKESGDLGAFCKGNGDTVNIYTVFPLYSEEIAYEKKHGIIALLERFQQKDIPIVFTVNRQNAV